MTTDIKQKTHEPISPENNVLLALLPFWTPLIPPMGIACLKSYLRQHGCEAKTIDANTENQFKEIYNKYFDILKEAVPRNRKGNFYSIGHDVLHHHLMAYLNYTTEPEYIQLIKEVIYNTFYFEDNARHICAQVFTDAGQ